MEINRDAWLEVNLDKLKSNIKTIKNHIKKETEIIGVVKANAYGFGDIEITRTLIETGINRFAVSNISEALRIREEFENIEILILGPVPDGTVDVLVKYNLTPAVFRLEFAELLSKEAIKQNKIAKIHLVIDTGMNRIGYKEQDTNIEELLAICKLPNIEVEGIFSHFVSPKGDEEMSKKQVEKLKKVLKKLEKENIRINLVHICNSFGILKYPEYNFDAVRPGIIMYGSEEGITPKDSNFKVNYIGEIKCKISNLKTIKKGEGVSYGHKFIADKDTKIATLPIGYADGIIRQLSGKMEVLIGGKRCNQVGRICMDQMMVDVSEVDCKIGDEVVILGKQGKEEITILEFVKCAGEVATSYSTHFAPRLTKVYIKNNEIYKIIDEFLGKSIDKQKQIC